MSAVSAAPTAVIRPKRLGLRRALVPVPFAIWQPLALSAEFLPAPPITRNQIELMRIDNVASPSRPGFAALGIAPHGIEAVLPVPAPAPTLPTLP
jgi:NADH dehydrogenase